MGWNRRDEDWQADRYRDERKHEPRPGERAFSAPSSTEPPARLDRPLTTAMDIVALVKLTPNYTDCERLVQQYADMVAASARVEETEIALARLQPTGAGQ